MSYFNYSKKRMREDYNVIRSLAELHLNSTSYKPVIALLRGRKFKEINNLNGLCEKRELKQLVRALSSEGLGMLTMIPEDLRDVALLEAVDLSWNSVSKVPSWLARLALLRNISLKGNRLSDWPAAFGELNFLERIDLSGNRIGSIPDSAISHMGQLEKLSLSYCGLKEFRSAFPNDCQLYYLDLSWNNIEYIDAELSQCGRLEYLELGNMKLTSFPKDICALSGLQYLSLSGNQVMRIPAEITQLTNLRFIDLSECELTSIPLDLLQLPELEELHLGGNYFTEEYRERITEEAPERLKLDFKSIYDAFGDDVWD
jgi:Leucine-rich repeat (LRR) protein